MMTNVITWNLNIVTLDLNFVFILGSHLVLKAIRAMTEDECDEVSLAL